MPFKINVLVALTGFRKARGASDADAAAWANANLSQGQELADAAAALGASAMDPRAANIAALTALKTLAAS
jgi:hypothetical protein